MNKKYIYIGIALAGLLLENVLVVGVSRKYSYAEPKSKLVITDKSGKSTSLKIDASSLVNSQEYQEYKPELQIVALKNITGDNNIDKEVQNQLEANIKAVGSEQKFLDGLKKMNMDKAAYTESLEYNMLFNKALSKFKIEVSDNEASTALKNGTIQVPSRLLKIYSSTNKQSLLSLQSKLNDNGKIAIPPDVQNGVIQVGENNKDFWNVISNLPDGNCSKLITVASNNYLVYNITTISDTERLRQAVNNLKQQRAIQELNSKIQDECNSFTYKLN